VSESSRILTGGAKKSVDGFVGSCDAQACVNTIVENAQQAWQFNRLRLVISGWNKESAVARWVSDASR